ncbi:M15 family metallopeptidase [Clostridium sp. D2Q-14]|uniref:M15 family metallopeptidase n=1 Tax=Anaeromonas gelatinilytica TaxID=2683194 RepID=UPI00193C6AE5|nr:M15 family metallopeptidase [Anaeromonas gelatinilytica]MBS4534896.1 M15 family metallopeptidase [Anaeromonas gelatinilytica]
MKKKPYNIFLLILFTSIIVFICGCGINANKGEPNDEDIEKEEPNEPIKDENLKESYLESTVKINSEGLKVVTNPSDILVLANKERNLPPDYEPEDLINPDIPFVQGQDSPVRFMREEAGLALAKMFSEAEKEDIIYYGRSGYRSYQIQQTLFNNYVEAHGEEAANKFSARPGQSEHQTGLAMDITSESVNNQLTEKFGETEDGLWLKKNAHKFGFILRYPKGKENITGYQYEPWHFRYVGKKIAKEIYELDVTLEEYFRDYY